MNASAIIRKLKDLDSLEKRVKETVNPSQKMLQLINTERDTLLKGDQNEKIPGK